MQHIHQPKGNKEVPLPPEPKDSLTYYGVLNKKFGEANEKTYAFKNMKGDFTGFYVKGSKDGNFYNPWDNDVKRNFEWLSVKEHVFNLYISFLNSHKDAFILEAQKEYIYGS